MYKMIASSWNYRYFIFMTIKNNLISQFSRSILGGVWIILNPLAMVLMYTIIFSKIIGARTPNYENAFSYPQYLIAGILGWTLFSETIIRCLTIFLEHGELIKKIAFPKICLPLIVTGHTLVNTLCLFFAILIIYSCNGCFPTVKYLWLPCLFTITLLFALSIGLLLGVLNVFIRDIGNIMNIILQFWFWGTPVVYFKKVLPEIFKTIIKLNPMYYIIENFHKVLVFNESPSLLELFIVLAVSIILLFFAFLLFRKASTEMVDAL